MCDEMLTKRLRLRQWKEEDRALFADINIDPIVMQHFPRKFSRVESDKFIDDNTERIAKNGWGAWAIDIIDSDQFIGFVGFSHPAPWHPCTGEIDIGWRLSRQHWGYGYATEAAKYALEIGFNSFHFNDVVSFTSACNLRSISVMKKIGMLDDQTGFQHPRIDEGSPLRKHVVYHLTRTECEALHPDDCADTVYS